MSPARLPDEPQGKIPRFRDGARAWKPTRPAPSDPAPEGSRGADEARPDEATGPSKEDER